MAIFNVHDIVRFRLIGPRGFSESPRYINYRSNSKGSDCIDFSVELCRFQPDVHGCAILDHNYYVKENYLFCKSDRYKMLEWQIEIRGLESDSTKVKIHIVSPLFRHLQPAYALIEGLVVDSMLQFALAKKGYALVHASSICRDNQAFILTARGGAGKTRISTYLAENGYDLISDNFVVLGSDRVVRAFVEPLNVFSYNANETILESISLRERISLEFKNLLYKLTRGYMKLFTRVNPDRIYGNLAGYGNLHSSFLLIPSIDSNNCIELSTLTKSQMISHIVLNQRMEFPLLDKYLLFYSFVCPEGYASSHWSVYRDILEQSLMDRNLRIIVPSTLSLESLDEIMETISNG